MKHNYIFILLILLYSCEHIQSERKMLNINSIENFNYILKDYSLNGHQYQIDSALYIDNIYEYSDKNFIEKKDTIGYSFFKLFDDSLIVVVAVNRDLCYLSIMSDFNDSYFINNSLIFPYNFSFLNDENLGVKFDCINNDSINFREISYDYNLIGEWKIDSIINFRINDDMIKKISKLKVLNDSIALIDETEYQYNHNGYEININESPFQFYKVFINENKMILINTFKESYIEYYFSSCR